MQMRWAFQVFGESDNPHDSKSEHNPIKHAERNKRISKKNPVPYEYSILTVHTTEGYTHWTLLYDKKYFDPEFGLIEGEYPHGKITSFLEIYV